ncbi:hypothetical protein BDR26DRAFT_240120 [Obelidium mucronatum]|nr:hypothetical protein BDR26DRAFT_240120 [Obelidium mucronatum]
MRRSSSVSNAEESNASRIIERPSVTLSDYSLGGSSTSILVPGAVQKVKDEDIRKRLGRSSKSSLDNSSRDSLTIPNMKAHKSIGKIQSKDSFDSPEGSKKGFPVRRSSCDNDFGVSPRSPIVNTRPTSRYRDMHAETASQESTELSSTEKLKLDNEKLQQQIKQLMKQNQQLVNVLESQGLASSSSMSGAKAISKSEEEDAAFVKNIQNFFYDQDADNGIDLGKIQSRSSIRSHTTASRTSLATDTSIVSRKPSRTTSVHESARGSPVSPVSDQVPPLSAPVLTAECPTSDDFFVQLARTASNDEKRASAGLKQSAEGLDKSLSNADQAIAGENGGKKSGKWFKGLFKKESS